MRYAKICRAINNKTIIEFYYDGYRRVVEPHCHGETHDNNPALRGYQIRGNSTSGNIPDWRMFRLDQASDIKFLDNSFLKPRPGYKKGDKGMSQIYCEL